MRRGKLTYSVSDEVKNSIFSYLIKQNISPEDAFSASRKYKTVDEALNAARSSKLKASPSPAPPSPSAANIIPSSLNSKQLKIYNELIKRGHDHDRAEWAASVCENVKEALANLESNILKGPDEESKGVYIYEKKIMDDKCSICLENFVIGEEIRSLPCIHNFHKICIDKALEIKQKKTCPVCLSKI